MLVLAPLILLTVILGLTIVFRPRVTRHMGGRVIQYEPGLPASGMTLFGEGGFVLGPEALASQAELIQTCLHELYRLATSEIGRGAAASRSVVAAGTQAAFGFAQRAYEAYFGEV